MNTEKGLQKSVRMRISLRFASRVCANAHAMEKREIKTKHKLYHLSVCAILVFTLDFRSDLRGETANLYLRIFT